MRPLAGCSVVIQLRKCRIGMEQNYRGRRETLANTWGWVRRFGLSAAEAGRPAAQAVTRWRRSAAESVVSSVHGEKRQKAVSVTCSGHLGAKYHSDLEPVPSTGWGGQSGASTHRSTDRWRGRENNGMAASQTELPYCSDKAIGREGGGEGGGTGGRHTCFCRWSNSYKQQTEGDERDWAGFKCESSLSSSRSEGISGLCESTSEITAQGKSWKWQMKEDITLTEPHSLTYAVHSHNTDVLIHAFRHKKKKKGKRNCTLKVRVCSQYALQKHR